MLGLFHFNSYSFVLNVEIKDVPLLEPCCLGGADQGEEEANQGEEEEEESSEEAPGTSGAQSLWRNYAPTAAGGAKAASSGHTSSTSSAKSFQNERRQRCEEA